MDDEHAMHHDNSEHHDHESSNKTIEYIKFAILVSAIAGTSFFLNSWFGSNAPDELMRWFMGVFFVTFGLFKFIGYEMFTETFPTYDILAARSKIYTYAYPFIELLLGSLYLLNSIPTIRDLFTFALMSVSAYGVYITLKARGNIKCACLGNVIKLPLSTVSSTENVIMAAMALAMLVLA